MHKNGNQNSIILLTSSSGARKQLILLGENMFNPEFGSTRIIKEFSISKTSSNIQIPKKIIFPVFPGKYWRMCSTSMREYINEEEDMSYRKESKLETRKGNSYADPSLPPKRPQEPECTV
jgi:hypothetical protein